MKIRPLTRAEVRALDAHAITRIGLPGIALMENAGRAAATRLVTIGIGGPVVVCCGKGNNGGDGSVLARHLDASGFAVRVVLICPDPAIEGDAAVNLGVLRACGIDVHGPDPDLGSATTRSILDRADWVVDGLLGTGAAGVVRDPLRAAIERINALPNRIQRLAIDIPSGLDCDTGAPLGVAVRADHTVTFVAPKVGFSSPVAAEFLGVVHVEDIGMPRSLLTAYQCDQ